MMYQLGEVIQCASESGNKFSLTVVELPGVEKMYSVRFCKPDMEPAPSTIMFTERELNKFTYNYDKHHSKLAKVME